MSITTVEELRAANFANSFVSLAVCEIRFPAVYDIDEELTKRVNGALKQAYPIRENSTLALQAGAQDFSPLNAGKRVIYYSSDRCWCVSFQTFSAALETRLYAGGTEFRKRLKDLVEILNALELGNYLRVGYRCVNTFPEENIKFENAFQGSLQPSIDTDIAGDIRISNNLIEGQNRRSSYVLRYGFDRSSATRRTSYLDIDCHIDSVAPDTLNDSIDNLSYNASLLFLGCIKPELFKIIENL